MTEPHEPTDTDVEVTRVELGESAPSSPNAGPNAGPKSGLEAGPSLPRGAMVGRYVILDELGAGGMGEVFSAYDPELDRRIALKLVKLRQKERTEHARGRLLREAQALAKLSHPNVVAVYDVGTHADRVFIAMEYVEGRTIGDWIDDAPKEPTVARLQEGLHLMLQAGRGLAAAHAQGLVHRDFKPANIMVSADGRVRVLDFGLARRFGEDDVGEDSGPTPRDASRDGDHDSLESGSYSYGSLSSRSSLRMQLTQAGLVMGTPAYMAPEQFFGGHIDARTDQFSFCVVLYRVLLGDRPFAGETYAELGRAVARGQLREPAKAAGVPRGLRQLLRRGLSASRDARYPTMDELLAELERATSSGRRRRVRLATIAGVVGLGGIVTAITLAATDTDAPCKGAESKLHGVWDEPLRAALTAAFGGTGVAYAEDARTTATRTLDEYAEHWVELHTQTCAATRVRGDQSEALMDLRIGCLDGKLRDMAALTGVLASADADVVKNAVQATGALPSPDECVTLERGATLHLQPQDPALVPVVEAVREQVARARARGLAGKYDDGLAEAHEALTAAKEARYEPAIAEAAVTLGELLERKMSVEPARDAYEEALYAAAASGHARVEAQALIGLSSVWGMHLNDTEAALRYARQAQAVTRRLGNPPELEAAIALYRGNANMIASRLEVAQEDFRRAVERSEGVAAAERIHLAALNNLGATHGQQGHYREAADTFLRALELTEARLGTSHPTVASNHLGLGVTYSRLEDYERAMDHTRRALEVYERSLGPNHPDLGRGHHNLGVVQAATGDLQGAHASYLRALEIKTRALGRDHNSVAFTANNVGDSLIRLGRPAEAIPYLEDAQRIWTTAHGEDNPSNVFALVSLAEAHLALEQPTKAERAIRRALALAEIGELDPVEIAKARFVAARAVWRVGDRGEALELAEQAKVGYEASERPSPTELAAIEAWIAAPQ